MNSSVRRSSHCVVIFLKSEKTFDVFMAMVVLACLVEASRFLFCYSIDACIPCARESQLRRSPPVLRKQLAAYPTILRIKTRHTTETRSLFQQCQYSVQDCSAYFSEPAKRRSRCGSVRGNPVLSSHLSPGFAPHVEQRTDRAGFSWPPWLHHALKRSKKMVNSAQFD
jgi:hypothetical protein